MACLTVNNVCISGVSACVPKEIEENIQSVLLWDEKDAKNFISTTGVERKRCSLNSTTASDLCFQAANKLIDELGWSKESIECLIFVTQNSDYILPATAPTLQERLGLSIDCYALDISLGCSGWVYGLSVISSLMTSGCIKRGLLLAGDTILKVCSREDKATYPLFGEAGTATALSYSTSSAEMYFQMNTDGTGKNAIIVNDGGFRNPVSSCSPGENNYSKGILNRSYLTMDGMSVFSFGISRVPESIKYILTKKCLTVEQIDYFILHQANLFMNEKIRKKLSLPAEKVPYSLKDFGNTSCATIPLTMVTQMQEDLRKRKLLNVACGFGVGLSWGSVLFETKKIVCCDLLEL